MQPGKSTRLALKNSTVVTPEHTATTRKPTFNIEVASKCAPDTDWSTVHSNFSLDSRKLRRYVVEDLMFADPMANERLLLLISTKHPAFGATWITIWNEQDSKRNPVTIARETYFQVEAEVVKNSKQKGFIDGMYSQNDVKHFVTYEGGEGLCLAFPGCSSKREIELKFASVIHETETFMVFGDTKACRDYSSLLLKLRSHTSQELVYSRMLVELHGDHSQTLFLSSNYKLFSVAKKDVVATEKKKVLFQDIESAISFGGTSYNDLLPFHVHVSCALSSDVFMVGFGQCVYEVWIYNYVRNGWSRRGFLWTLSCSCFGHEENKAVPSNKRCLL